MIKTFVSKDLAKLWGGKSHKIDSRLVDRITARLDALDAASRAEDMNVPGFDFHALRGFRPARYTVHVNGPYAITFEFRDGDAYKVDLDNYH